MKSLRRENELLSKKVKVSTLGKRGRIAGCEFQQGSVFFSSSASYRRLKANHNHWSCNI